LINHLRRYREFELGRGIDTEESLESMEGDLAQACALGPGPLHRKMHRRPVPPFSNNYFLFVSTLKKLRLPWCGAVFEAELGLNVSFESIWFTTKSSSQKNNVIEKGKIKKYKKAQHEFFKSETKRKKYKNIK